MILQIIDSEPKHAVERWMNYLSLILPSNEQKSADGDNISGFNLHSLDKLKEIWEMLPKNVELSGKTIETLEKIDKLSVSEIKEYRDYIEKLPEEERADWYLELQKKVPYHNQRNNESTLFKKDSIGKETTQKVNIGDVMCNITCTAMALEMLGLSNPCANDIPPLQYEDCIEKNITWVQEGTFKYKPLNDGNKYDNAREWAEGRKSAAKKMFGDKVEVTTRTDLKVTTHIDEIKALIMERLKLGDGVIVSYSSHFIRIISCDDNGYYYDDPYGKYTITSTGKDWNRNYNGKTSEEGVGQNNYRSWSDFDILVESQKFTIEYYHLK